MLDHLMWVCADLEQGVKQIEALTGVRAEVSGSHRGLGTCNALLSLGDAVYLEILAPDPEQPLANNFGGRLAKLKTPGLLAFALGNGNLPALRQNLIEQNISTSEVTRTRRDTEAGETLEWDLLFVRGTPGAPFYIDWLKCVHPAKTSPVGCTLRSLTVEVADAKSFGVLLVDEDPFVQLRANKGIEVPRLNASLDTPKGIVTLGAVTESISLF